MLPFGSTVHALRTAAFGLVLSLAVLAGGQSACAARQLPVDAAFAKAAEFNYPYVRIGKKVVKLAVGGRIYNEDNLIIMPATVPPTLNVLYKTDINGEISQIWILNDEETRYFSDNPPKANTQ